MPRLENRIAKLESTSSPQRPWIVVKSIRDGENVTLVDAMVPEVGDLRPEDNEREPEFAKRIYVCAITARLGRDVSPEELDEIVDADSLADALSDVLKPERARPDSPPSVFAIQHVIHDPKPMAEDCEAAPKEENRQ